MKGPELLFSIQTKNIFIEKTQQEMKQKGLVRDCDSRAVIE